jgi:predicted ester cyclase
MSGIPMPLNNDGWNAFMVEFTQAFPDAQISVEASVAERDVVESRWTITGKHGGPLRGVPATGRLVSFAGNDFSRVVDGKVSEHGRAVRPGVSVAPNYVTDTLSRRFMSVAGSPPSCIR